MSFIKYGSASISGINYGSTSVRAVYYGSQWVWGIAVPIGTENLELSPSGTVHFDAAGESKYIAVTSHATWYVTKDSSSWISLNKASGSSGEHCLITCAENTDFSPRTGTVTFTCGTLSKTINVYQAQFVPEFVVEPSSFILNSASSTTITFSFTIDSRCEWTIGSSSWITVDPNNVHGSGSRQNIQATIAANTGGQRTGYISISEDEGQANTVEISVQQPGAVVQPTATVRAINWYNNPSNSWLNKQSWQVELKGGSTSKTLTNVTAFIQDDSGNTIQVLDVPSSISLNANQTIYLGLNASDFDRYINAQLSYNGQTVEDDSYELVFYSDTLSDQAVFASQDI